MPYILLMLLLALAACSPRPEPARPEAPTAPDASPSATADPDAGDTPRSDTTGSTAEPGHGPAMAAPSTPVLTTFRTGDGVLVNLTFRTTDGTTISDSEPLILDVGGSVFEAPLASGPARFSDPDGTVVDQAGYTLDKAGFRALLQTRADAVTVRVADADAYRSYPYLSGDTVE